MHRQYLHLKGLLVQFTFNLGQHKLNLLTNSISITPHFTAFYTISKLLFLFILKGCKLTINTSTPNLKQSTRSIYFISSKFY